MLQPLHIHDVGAVLQSRRLLCGLLWPADSPMVADSQLLRPRVAAAIATAALTGSAALTVAAIAIAAAAIPRPSELRPRVPRRGRRMSIRMRSGAGRGIPCERQRRRPDRRQPVSLESDARRSRSRAPWQLLRPNLFWAVLLGADHRHCDEHH